MKKWAVELTDGDVVEVEAEACMIGQRGALTFMELIDNKPCITYAYAAEAWSEVMLMREPKSAIIPVSSIVPAPGSVQ